MRLRNFRLCDITVLARMVWLLVKLEALQHVLPLPALIRRFDARPRPRRRPDDLERLAWLSGALLRRLYRRRYCMKQSLLLFYFMRKRAHPVRIHFGIARRGDALAGHAWISLDGAPFCEASNPTDTYRPVFSYPSSSTHEVTR